jgi:hypothetical protein
MPQVEDGSKDILSFLLQIRVGRGDEDLVFFLQRFLLKGRSPYTLKEELYHDSAIYCLTIEQPSSGISSGREPPHLAPDRPGARRLRRDRRPPRVRHEPARAGADARGGRAHRARRHVRRGRARRTAVGVVWTALGINQEM